MSLLEIAKGEKVARNARGKQKEGASFLRRQEEEIEELVEVPEEEKEPVDEWLLAQEFEEELDLTMNEECNIDSASDVDADMVLPGMEDNVDPLEHFEQDKVNSLLK